MKKVLFLLFLTFSLIIPNLMCIQVDFEGKDYDNDAGYWRVHTATQVARRVTSRRIIDGLNALVAQQAVPQAQVVQQVQAVPQVQANPQANDTRNIMIFSLICAIAASITYPMIYSLDDSHLSNMHDPNLRATVMTYGSLVTFTGSIAGAVSGLTSCLKRILPQTEVNRSISIALFMATATIFGIVGLGNFRDSGGFTNIRSYFWSALALGLYKGCIDNILGKR